MFNFKTALQSWNGQDITLADLQKRLSDLRLHVFRLQTAFPSVLALERQWIVEDQSGRLHIQVPEAVVA